MDAVDAAGDITQVGAENLMREVAPFAAGVVVGRTGRALGELAEDAGGIAKKRGPGRYVARAETKGAEAAAYEERVAGGRAGQAYEIPYDNPKPRGRPHVYFDGEVGGVPIDSKTAIVTRAKTVDQARRQAEALRQNGSIGVWKVPSEYDARRARQMIDRANARDTIFIVVEK
jgi:hypothetical protein